MFEIICGVIAIFSAGWVFAAVTGPIWTTRNPVSITALVVGTVLLIMLFR